MAETYEYVDPLTRLKRENRELQQKLQEALGQNTDYCIALTEALGLRGNITPEMKAIGQRIIAKHRAGEPKA